MLECISILCGVLICFLILIRVFYLIFKIRSGANKYSTTKRAEPMKVMICIGSGGHTTEMIKLIENLDPEIYSPRYYVMTSTDTVSENKILALEENSYKSQPQYKIFKIPRSRFVNQSYITSVFTTLGSILCCVPIMLRINPDLILCNGPGTCIPICLIAFIMKVFFIGDNRIVFVESICRVETLSLSGKILSHFADNIVVHWEELKRICKRADYLGQLF